MFRLGNYIVLDKLYQYLPEARTAKAHLDHILDLCGEPATGIAANIHLDHIVDLCGEPATGISAKAHLDHILDLCGVLNKDIELLEQLNLILILFLIFAEYQLQVKDCLSS